MTTWADCQLGFKKESVYGTGVTVDRFIDANSYPPQLNLGFVQSGSFRDRVLRSGRECSYVESVGTSIEVEPLSKGFGTFFELLMGTGSSKKLTGPTGVYMQSFTLADLLPSATIQIGVPHSAATWAEDPYTLTGMVCEDWSASFGNAELLKVSANFKGQQLATGTALASESYATGAQMFCFKGASLHTGTLTAPTDTSLASATVELASVESGSLSVKHTNQWRRPMGGGGLQSYVSTGRREISGEIVVEYDSTDYRDWIINQTSKALVITYEATTAIETTYYPTVQFCIPSVTFDGDIAAPNGGQVIRQTLKWRGKFDGTNEPLYVNIQTADTAL